MSLPQHAYGTAQHEEPHAWVLRLHGPFLLAWPESPDAASAVKLWPRPALHHPDLHRQICGLMSFGSYRSFTYTFEDHAPLSRHLYLEEPDGPWAAVIDLHAGLLFVPNNLGILIAVRDFSISTGHAPGWAAPEETLAAAQRWHDDFITDPEFV